MSESRIQFPGFALRESTDQGDFHVEVGTIEDGMYSFVLTLCGHVQFAHLPPTIAQVTDPNEEMLWKYRKEKVDGIAHLAMAGDTPSIVIVERGLGGKVISVTPLASLVDKRPMGVKRQIELKASAGEFLGREVLETAAERTFREHVSAGARKAEAEQREAAQRAYEAREAEKRKRVQRILERDIIVGFTSDRQERAGLPVCNDEWPQLPHGTEVILVETFDAETEGHGRLIEYFKVHKEPGRHPQPRFQQSVTDTAPVVREQRSAESYVKRRTYALIDDDHFEVLVFETMDQIRAARGQGLNSGTYAAVEPPAGESLTVYAVHHDEIVTIGKRTEVGA